MSFFVALVVFTGCVTCTVCRGSSDGECPKCKGTNEVFPAPSKK